MVILSTRHYFVYIDRYQNWSYLSIRFCFETTHWAFPEKKCISILSWPLWNFHFFPLTPLEMLVFSLKFWHSLGIPTTFTQPPGISTDILNRRFQFFSGITYQRLCIDGSSNLSNLITTMECKLITGMPL